MSCPSAYNARNAPLFRDCMPPLNLKYLLYLFGVVYSDLQVPPKDTYTLLYAIIPPETTKSCDCRTAAIQGTGHIRIRSLDSTRTSSQPTIGHFWRKVFLEACQPRLRSTSAASLETSGAKYLPTKCWCRFLQPPNYLSIGQNCASYSVRARCLEAAFAA